MKKSLIVSMLFLPLLLCACNAQEYEVTEKEDGISEFMVTKKTMSLSIGQSEVLSAFAQVEGEQPTYTFTVTGDQSAIQISSPYDDNGFKSVLVTGVAKGNAKVVVNAGNHFAMCDVTVGGGSGAIVPVESISLSPSSKTAYVSETETSSFEIYATVLPQNATNKTISWSTTDETIASISAQGEVGSVVCKKAGTATIKAKAGNKEASCVVTVKQRSDSDELEITLDKQTASLKEGENLQLNADVNKEATITWQSDKPAVASVSNTGFVNALSQGTATISATATNGTETDTASCTITVTSQGGGSDYENEIALWSKPGHLYLHYLRDDKDYDPWAVWMWQKLPNGLEGSLWGATHCPETVTSMTDHWMTNAEVGKSGNGVYSDLYGQVCDIDLTRDDIVDGKEGELSPIIQDWDNLAKARIGFLIVDQSKMGGGSHWTSDGGIEAYIKNLAEKFPEGKESYLHIYCVSGSVASFTYSSGQSVAPNPTATDTTGNYRSKNDITNLKQDAYKAGVSTSQTFLEDRPGTGYQIFVPSYADSDGDGMGDLRGIINKLDYIEDLGVKVLWLTPIQESDSYHGYDVTDYYKIDSKFGTLEDYQELLFKAHQKGMKVLMDMVINHTSKNNVLFTKSQRAEVEQINGKTINYRDMYLWKFEGDKVREWDGIVPEVATTPATYKNINVEDSEDWYRDGSSKYYYFGKFGSGMAELNYSNQATRDYMTDMCKYWLSFGLDGFRLDAIKHIYLSAELDPVTASAYANDNITYDVSYRTAYDEQIGDYVTMKNDYSYDRDLNVMFWKQFSGAIKSAYPNCYLVGENFDGWNERIAPFYEAIDSQFDFSTYYHLNELQESSIGSDIKATLSYNKAKRSNHINGAFTSNHDIARMLNHAGANGDASHTSEITNANKELANNRARYFAATTILTPGVSWIYYGDELGMSGNLKDVVTDSKGNLVDDHGNNIDRWYRQPMRWGREQGKDNVPIYIFSGLEVNWDLYNRNLATASEQQVDNNSMFNFFKAACTAKNDPRYPTYGYIDWSGTCGAVTQSVSMQISDGTRTARVFINNTGSPIDIPAMDQGELIGSSYGGTSSKVPAYGFVVVKG